MENLPEYTPITLPHQLECDLDSFKWNMRALLGGNLISIAAQKPSWPEPSPHARRWINLLVLVADPSVPYCESLFRQEYLRRNPTFSFPTEIVGYGDLLEKLRIGDPAVVYMCASGHPIYDTNGAFVHLQEIARQSHITVNAERLRGFLQTKSLTHFRNVGYLLARLLNEIYMGTVAGITMWLVQNKNDVTLGFLYRAAQWKELKEIASSAQIPGGIVDKVESLLTAIRSILSADEKGEQLPSLPDFAWQIVALSQELAEQVGVSKVGSTIPRVRDANTKG